MERVLLSLRSYYYPSSLLLVGPLPVERVLVGAALARVMAHVQLPARDRGADSVFTAVRV